MRNIISSLVVVFMIVVGAMILLPCIKAVRLAAKKSICGSNLRQIGLTVQNFETLSPGKFPQAARPNPNLAPKSRLSWLYEITPFIQATNVFERMDRERGWEADENRYLAVYEFPRLYRCPAFEDRVPQNTLIPTSYIGIAGVGRDAADLPLGDPNAGFFGYDRRFSHEGIEGRAGSILMAIETSQTEGAWTAAGPATVRGLDTEGPTYVGLNGQFGGMHTGGAIAVFADASVHHQSASIDRHVLEAMARLTDKSNKGRE